MGGWERRRGGGGGETVAERDAAEHRLWGLTGLDLAGLELAGTHTCLKTHNASYRHIFF